MKKLLLLIFCTTSSLSAQIINFPDPNLKARLLQNTYVDTNNDGEIDVTEALNVTRLRIDHGNISDVTGIEYFANIDELECNHNNISTLDLTSFSNLEEVNAGDNPLTSIAVSGLTNLKFLYLSNNQLSSIDLNGLPNLLILSINDNQITTLDVQALTGISSIACEGNLLTSLDVSNLSALVSLKCANNLLESLNIKNGSFERYGWGFSGNPTLRYICADTEQFTDVENKIIEYGYTDCYVNSLCSYVSGQNFYSISGDTLFDEESDGCDMNDAIYPNLEFTLSDGSNTATAFSDATGNYHFDIQDGTYTVTPVEVNPTYFSFSPASVTVNFPNDPAPNIQDFCVTPNGIYSDLTIEFRSAGVEVFTNISYPLSGPVALLDTDLTFSFRIFYQNKGTTTQSGTLNYGFTTEEVTMVSSTPVAASQTSNILSWNFTGLRPFETREILVTIEFTGQNTHNFFHTATVTPSETDFTPADNTISLTHEISNVLNTPAFTFSDYFTMYPNPTRNMLHMKLKKDILVASFSIYNMLGQKVKTITYRNEDLTTIDVTDLKSGQYFIRIATEKTLFTKRFIKQ